MRRPRKQLERNEEFVANSAADLARDGLVCGQETSFSGGEDSIEVSEGPSDCEDVYSDNWESAICGLEGYGVHRDQARQALAATRGSHVDCLQWVNEALNWICEQEDLQRECQEMRLAMARSLREHQETIGAEIPLEKKSPDDLRAMFKSSTILQQLDSTTWSSALFCSPLKDPLIQFLKLEKNCLEKWYPGRGTAQFFFGVGQECLRQLDSGTTDFAVSSPAEQQDSQNESENEAGGKKSSRKKSRKPKQVSRKKCEAGAEIGCCSSRPDALVAFLKSKAQLVLEAVSRMPGTSGETPSIFKVDRGEAETSDSEVEIIESRSQPRTEDIVSLV